MRYLKQLTGKKTKEIQLDFFPYQTSSFGLYTVGCRTGVSMRIGEYNNNCLSSIGPQIITKLYECERNTVKCE